MTGAIYAALFAIAAAAPPRVALEDGAPGKYPDVDRLLVLGGPESPRNPGVPVLRLEPVALLAVRDQKGPVAIKAGVWPGLRTSVSYEGERDVGFASATTEPWANHNGWLINYVRGVAPDAQPILVYDPPRAAAPKIGSTALALAEAAVFGGSFAVRASALREPGDARGRADIRRTRAQLQFLGAHPEWFDGSSETPVWVLADRLAGMAEVMNLLVRRNLPFRAFTSGRRPVGEPAVLVEPPWAGDPSAFAAEVRTRLGDRRPFRLSNAQQVIANLLNVAAGKRVLHLLNYGIDPIQDVRIQLARQPARATLYAPGPAEATMLEIHGGEITVKEMGAYCAIVLE